MRRRLLLVPVLASLALAPATQAGARPATTGPNKTVVLHVTITDKSVKLNSTLVQHATGIAFRVVNRGKLKHDFNLANVHTSPINPKEVVHLLINFEGSGSYRYFVKLNGSKKMSGILRVTGADEGQLTD
jgi:hypothetical protein